MIKRLGRRWAQLHRLIYLIAPLAILHYWWMKAGKHNFEQPIVWGLVVAVLLGLRVFWSWNRTRSPAASRPVRS
jgi:sulfoxide reductase heme-binding subunit YedZ